MPTYLTQSLHRMRRQSPGSTATVDGARRTTWAQLADRVSRLASVLGEAGVRDGDRVAVLAANSDRFLEAMLATFWAGGVLAPINTRWSAQEIAFALSDCGAKLLLADARLLPLAPASTPVLPLDRADEMIEGSAAAEDRLRADDDLACLVYTGGTTGRPKGVMLSHRGLATSAASYAGCRGGAPGAVVLQIAPMFHVGGLGTVLGALLAGSRQVFLPTFDPEALMQAVAREGVTDVFLVPTMLQAVLDHPRFAEFDLGGLERLAYGASPISDALLERALGALPKTAFMQAYGMTELSPIATLLGPEDHLPAARALGRHRSAGRATMMTEVRIVDPDDREAPVGAAGEIVVRGGNLMLGYWNRPDETAAALRGGWMHTGDVGRMDRDGYVYVVDRLKDMIVSGGENVYSAEVENALSTHPRVAQCAVIGVPHPLWGEAVHAVVVPPPDAAPTLAELAAHCRRTIADYKCPRSLELRGSLPLSAAGKVLKGELRASFAAGARP